jgi:hypothetical protein
MTPEATIEALRALHVEASYRTWDQWDGDLSTRSHPCCAVCSTRQGWPCQTKRILDTVEAQA